MCKWLHTNNWKVFLFIWNLEKKVDKQLRWRIFKNVCFIIISVIYLGHSEINCQGCWFWGGLVSSGWSFFGMGFFLFVLFFLNYCFTHCCFSRNLSLMWTVSQWSSPPYMCSNKTVFTHVSLLGWRSFSCSLKRFWGGNLVIGKEKKCSTDKFVKRVLFICVEEHNLTFLIGLQFSWTAEQLPLEKKCSSWVSSMTIILASLL